MPFHGSDEDADEDAFDHAFHAEADARWDALLAGGGTVPWDAARAWLEARARGEDVPSPLPCKPEA